LCFLQEIPVTYVDGDEEPRTGEMNAIGAYSITYGSPKQLAGSFRFEIEGSIHGSLFEAFPQESMQLLPVSFVHKLNIS